MASKNKQVLQSNPKTTKVFDYVHGNVSITITLRTDIKDELKSGLEIGKKFVDDVETELAKFK